MNDCFQSVSDGKTLIASAITDKGVETASDAMFAIMAENIASIQTGVDVSALSNVHSAYGSNKAFSSSYTATSPETYLAISYSGGQGTNNSTYANTSGTTIFSNTITASGGQSSITILFASLATGNTMSGGNPNAHSYNRAAFLVYKIG